jgi:hypothetical protein
MSVFASVSNYLKRPTGERRFAARNYLRRASDASVFRLAAGLQAANSPFFLQNRPDFHYDLERFEDFRSHWNAWTERHPTNSGDVSRLYAVYLNVQQLLKEGVPGDFVELGVYKGNSAKVIGNLIAQERRRLYLFDTFTGFDPRDLRHVDAGRPKSFHDTSLEQVREFVAYDNAVFVPGYFPESLDSHGGEIGPLAFVHVDCDLYAPMKAALERFYERASPGAMFMLHDYASGQWPGATNAVDEFLADKPERLTIVPDKSGTAIFRRNAR